MEDIDLNRFRDLQDQPLTKIKSPFHQALQENKFINNQLVYFLPGKNAKKKLLKINAKPVLGKTKKTIQVVITLQMLSEDELTFWESETQKEKYLQLYNLEMLGVFYFDHDGYIFNANATFLKKTKYSEKTIKDGKLQWAEITSIHCLDRVLGIQADLIKQKKIPPFEMTLIAADETRIPVFITVENKPETFNNVGIFMDISSVKNKERMREQFYRSFSHEIRSPITSLVCFHR